MTVYLTTGRMVGVNGTTYVVVATPYYRPDGNLWVTLQEHRGHAVIEMTKGELITHLAKG